MQILALSPAEVAHAVKRFRAYNNSTAQIVRHFRNRGERVRERTCCLLHALEVHFGIDLGALCGRFMEREEPGASPFERSVLELLAEWSHPSAAAGQVLLIHVDRVRALNALAEGDARALCEHAPDMMWALCELAPDSAQALEEQALDLALVLARRTDPV